MPMKALARDMCNGPSGKPGSLQRLGGGFPALWAKPGGPVLLLGFQVGSGLRAQSGPGEGRGSPRASSLRPSGDNQRSRIVDEGRQHLEGASLASASPDVMTSCPAAQGTAATSELRLKIHVRNPTWSPESVLRAVPGPSASAAPAVRLDPQQGGGCPPAPACSSDGAGGDAGSILET